MTEKKLSQGAIALLTLAPVALVMTAMFVSMPWLKQQPDGLVEIIAAVAVVLVVGWSMVMTRMAHRRQDEVERASTAWAWQKGAAAGSIVIVLLLALPQFRDFVNDSVNGFLMEAKGHTRQSAVIGFVAGFVTLSLAQTLGTVVMAIVWWSKRLSAS